MWRKRGKIEKAGGGGSGRSMMAWMPSPLTIDLLPRLSALPPSPAPSSPASSGGSWGGMFSWCLLLASSSLPAELWWMTPPALKPGLLAGSGGGDQKAPSRPSHSSFTASPLPVLSGRSKWVPMGLGWAPTWAPLFSSFPPSAIVPEGGKTKRGDYGAHIFFQS